MSTLFADLEGDGLLDTLSKIWIVSIGDADTGKIVSYYEGSPHGTVEDAIDRLSEADRTVWHNGLGYDLPAMLAVYGKAPDWRRVADTLILSKLENPIRPGVRPHALASWGHRVGIHKVPDLDWTVWSPGMIERCEKDVEITAKVWQRLKYMLEDQPEAVAIEHACAWETTNMIHRGMLLDVKHAESLLDELLLENEQRAADLRDIFPPILVPQKASQPERVLKTVNKAHPLHGKLDPGSKFCPVVVQEFNPGSREQIAERLIRRYGWQPQDYTEAGQVQINKDILHDLPYEEAEPLKKYLDTAKKVSQINGPPKRNGTGGGWLHHLSATGRVHAGLNPLGTVTGRPSCSAPNVQQVDKDKRMRRCWVPTSGRLMVGVDASGLELRCLSHYLHRLDGGAYMRTLLEDDIHTVVMNLWGFYDRDQTKRGEYGWLYGAGDPKLGLICAQDAAKAGKPINHEVLGITKAQTKNLKTVGKRMRTLLEEGVTGVGELIEDVKKQSKKGTLRGIDKRVLQIRSEHSALNTLIQSAGAILVKKAITLIPPALEEAGLKQGRVDFTPAREWYSQDLDVGMVMWVHDEIQFEVRPGLEEKVGEISIDAIKRAGEMLNFRCPLDGEMKVGNSWAETH